MTITITLTTAGIDTGPFNLYSNADAFTSAFETGISRASLLAGYTSYVVPLGTTIVRVYSTGVCQNYIDIPIDSTTTTTTTVYSTTEINLVNASESGVTFGDIVVGSFSLPPGPGLYPIPGNTYLTSHSNGVYSITVTLYNVPNDNTTVRIDDGDIIQCYTYPAGVSVSHTFSGVNFVGLGSSITINNIHC